MIGIKLYTDGALGSRGAWLKAPYQTSPTPGLSLINDAELSEADHRRAANGYQVAVHAIGDAANDQVSRRIEQLRPELQGRPPLADRACAGVDPADLPRLARPGHRLDAADPPDQRPDDGRGAARARTARRRLCLADLADGVPLAFGSDFPVELPNPFPGLAAAISREDAQGQPAGGWRPGG